MLLNYFKIDIDMKEYIDSLIIKKRIWEVVLTKDYFFYEIKCERKVNEKWTKNLDIYHNKIYIIVGW